MVIKYVTKKLVPRIYLKKLYRSVPKKDKQPNKKKAKYTNMFQDTKFSNWESLNNNNGEIVFISIRQTNINMSLDSKCWARCDKGTLTCFQDSETDSTTVRSN